MLKSGEPVGQSAHVAAALNIVLAAERIQSSAIKSDMSGQQREIGQRENIVNCVVVFGDSERPANHRLICSSKRMRHFLNDVRSHARLVGRVLERIRLDRTAVFVESRCRVVDKFLALESGRDDFTRERIRQYDIRTHIDTRPYMCPLRRTGSPRIDRVQTGSVSDSSKKMMEKNRMCLSRVRSPQENDIGLFNFLIGIRATTRTENHRQTGDARSVSGSVATIDVVAAQCHARELLRDKIHFIGAFRTAEDSDCASTMLLHNGPQTVRRAIERLIPTRWA